MKHTTTTAALDPEAFAKLQDLVRDIGIAMVTTVTPHGSLHSRPMATVEFNDDGEIWFFTSDDSGKTRDLAEEHAVNLSYADIARQRYVSVTGAAHLVHDRVRAEELWDSDLQAWLPAGLDDPHLALLRVRIETAEYWDTSTRRMLDFFRRETASRGEKNTRAPNAAAAGTGRDEVQHTKVDIHATPASG